MSTTDAPLVSVTVATHNRADLLPEAVGSVLAQSMPDLEVVVVDDGSTDDTAEVVRGLREQDRRVRYVHQENAGISAARNHGADVARGLYTAVHDDDDIMLPWRLEKQLETIERGAAGAYGSFINFDDATGDLVFHHGRRFTHGAVLLTGFAPGHSTWLVRTDIMRTLRYDESLSSAVDNNLALRMLRSGVSLHHSGVMCVLRRVHGRSITAADAPNQSRAARMSREMLARGISAEAARSLQDRATFDWGIVPGRSRYHDVVSPYLPDHLARRSVAHADDAPPDGEAVTVRGADGRTMRYRVAPDVPLARLLDLHRTQVDLVVRPGNKVAEWAEVLAEHHLDRHLSALSGHHLGKAVVCGQADVALPGGTRLDVQTPTGSRSLRISDPLPLGEAARLSQQVPGSRIRLLATDLESAVPAVRDLAAGGAV